MSAAGTDATPRPPPEQSERSAWGLETPALGLAFGGAHAPDTFERQRRWVLRAEALGVHSIWLPEMHFAKGVCPAPLLGLSAFASITERVRLGTTSLLLPLHPAERLAADVATLDRLSGGRVLLGLGRGFRKPVFDAFGVDPSTKRDRFDESLEAMLGIWSQEAGAGAFVDAERPFPPLAVAAFGRKGLSQAARHGLPYLASPMEPLSILAENRAHHLAELEAAGHTHRPVSVAMRTLFAARDDTVARRVRAAFERSDAAPAVRLPKSVARAMDAPLAERLWVGTRNEVADMLARAHAELDLDLLIARPEIPAASETEQIESIEWLAAEGMAAAR